MFFLSGLMGLLLAGASISFLPEILTKDDDEEDEADGDVAAEELPEGDGTDLLDQIPPLPVAAETGQILRGSESRDLLEGAQGDDQANGYGGDDTLMGGEGDDVLWGGAGADVVLGGAGDDVLGGNDGDDLIRGGDGADILSGFFGNDTLEGDDGADHLIGGAGDDLLLGGAGDDTLEGNDGADTLVGGLGFDQLFGGKGADFLDGRETGIASEDGRLHDVSMRDFLNGGAGADTLLGGAEDWLHGGADEDLFAISGWSGGGGPTVIEDYDPAEDRIAVVLDADEDSSPEVTVEPSDGTEGAAWVVVNGMRIAEVLNGAGLTAEDIAVMSPKAFAAL